MRTDAAAPQNCWEMKDCGRQPGGAMASELGVCPAASDASGDGVNRGQMSGRVCWSIAGTFCQGTVQGTFAAKRTTCLACDFYSQVNDEEGLGFRIAPQHE